MSDDKAYAATPFDELERQIMDVNFAKNEREWWAWREICDLRAENEKLRAILFQFAAYDESVGNAEMFTLAVPAGVIRAAAAAIKTDP